MTFPSGPFKYKFVRVTFDMPRCARENDAVLCTRDHVNVSRACIAGVYLRVAVGGGEYVPFQKLFDVSNMAINCMCFPMDRFEN